MDDYCLRSWEEVEKVLNSKEELSIYDKILLASKEMRELNINNTMFWGKGCDELNEVFGLRKGEYRSCCYGIQGIYVFGYDYSMSALRPRVKIEYSTDFERDFEVYIGEEAPQSSKKKMRRNATEYETQKVYEFLLGLIEKRKAEIEKAKSNMPIEEFKEKALKVANEYLKGNFPKYECVHMNGKSAIDKSNSDALVIKVKGAKENSIFTQMGYIKYYLSKYNEYSIEVKALGCGGYNNNKVDLDNLDKIISDAVYFMAA